MKRIIFLIFPQTHLLDLAGVDQVFYEARSYGAELSVEYCTVKNVALYTSTGIPFGSIKSYEDIQLEEGDYLFIVGSEVDYFLESDLTNDKELVFWVRNAYLLGINICSICTGAFFLGICGLLDGIKCTTHWQRTKLLQHIYPKAIVVENILFTEDKRIFTSAGVTAGIDLALFILSRIADDNIAFKVARELVVYNRRKGNDVQESVFLNFRNHIHSGVHQVQDFICDNIHSKFSIDRLSEVVFMSSRNLTRIFRKETGISIHDYISLVRKERLRELSTDPSISRKQMAGMVGLKSERQVIRIMNTIGNP